ncbi:MAG: DNA topoisomerase I [Candidatus Marinimicrobia bacterium]|nr:DNA topoisomerase I [Candidatus Neomarinimicrobiota bacterium]
MKQLNKGLVIVESPSKIKTLKKFLGKEYAIGASVGHIRDLPKNDLGVDIDNNFKANYIPSPDKAKVIKELKTQLKNAETIYIATDPDREGEAIGWHLIETLKPKVPVKRIIFYEITKSAILESFNNTREINSSLVGAQEARRILDRLWGFLVSKKLWLNIKGGLSAGRVQSPAVKIIVDREKERSKFVENEYWSILGKFESNGINFEASLKQFDNKTIAIGKDFNKNDGTIKNNEYLVLDKKISQDLCTNFKNSNWLIKDIKEKPSTQNPYPPFITSTLQQEGIRKLKMSSQAVMVTAQKLYEAGLITYMRTDSINLSNEAISASRKAINESFNSNYLPEKPRVFKSKVKNAQEAHEAIRPAGSTFQHPDKLKNSLESSEWKLYNLIWKRTLASQMKSAKILNTSIDIINDNALLRATGKVIEFPGFLKIYVEDIDDPNKDKDDKENTLPKLKINQKINCVNFESNQHFTKPIARFTEASLVKELEKLGIGRPSTYSTIMSNIQKRGYVNKVKGAMIPTLTAYAVIQFLERYFTDLVNLQFTADMENILDSISRSEIKSTDFLLNFYNGSKKNKGLKELLDNEFDKNKSKTIMSLKNGSKDEVLVKIGRYGTYLQYNDKNTNLYDDFIPSDLTYKKAVNLFDKKKQESTHSFVHPETQQPIFLKEGRFGPYVQCDKKMKSLPPGITLDQINEKDAINLIDMPIKLGKHPNLKDDILKDIGRYGPYLRCGKKSASLPKDDDILNLSIERAIEIIDQSKNKNSSSVIKIIGQMPETKNNIELKDGRYGAYVTDGKINATIPKNEKIDDLSLEKAIKLILDKKAKGPTKRFKRKK